MEVLIKHQADLKALTPDKETALHLAARGGNPKMIELLLKHGADINALTKTQETPLHLAVVTDHLDAVELLLKYKPSLAQKNDEGKTALDLAKELALEDIVKAFSKKSSLKTPDS